MAEAAAKNAVGWAALAKVVEKLERRVEALEAGGAPGPVQQAELTLRLAAALQPLADLISPEAGILPDEAVVTRGHPLVHLPITAGQCRCAAELIALVRGEGARRG